MTTFESFYELQLHINTLPDGVTEDITIIGPDPTITARIQVTNKTRVMGEKDMALRKKARETDTVCNTCAHWKVIPDTNYGYCQHPSTLALIAKHNYDCAVSTDADYTCEDHNKLL
jgi:hypothetical protein